MIDLSVVPLIRIPPPSAVVSVAPVVTNVADPEEPVTGFDNVAVLFVIEAIVVPTGTLKPAVEILTAIPGINPVTGEIAVMLALLLTIAAVNVLAETSATSISLSSTLNTFVLIVVVVPLTVKLPLTIRFPPTFAFCGSVTSKLASPRTHVEVPEPITNWLSPDGDGGV